MRDRAPARIRRSAARTFAAEVVAVDELTPRMRRLTLAAHEFADVVPLGLDEYVGLLLPRDETTPLVMPVADAGENIRAAVAVLPDRVRPDLRWYTVRSVRPERGEIDIDMVVHGDDGPGTRFARRARPGVPVGVREGTALYNPPGGGGAQVLIGDETALPAIARILEGSGGRPHPRVFIETTDATARLPLAAPVRWVDRAGTPGAALEAAVRNATLPERIDYAWICAERTGVQHIRRHLVIDRAVPRSRITFSGYWRLGEPRR